MCKLLYSPIAFTRLALCAESRFFASAPPSARDVSGACGEQPFGGEKASTESSRKFALRTFDWGALESRATRLNAHALMLTL